MANATLKAQRMMWYVLGWVMEKILSEKVTLSPNLENKVEARQPRSRGRDVQAEGTASTMLPVGTNLAYSWPARRLMELTLEEWKELEKGWWHTMQRPRQRPRWGLHFLSNVNWTYQMVTDSNALCYLGNGLQKGGAPSGGSRQCSTWCSPGGFH